MDQAKAGADEAARLMAKLWAQRAATPAPLAERRALYDGVEKVFRLPSGIEVSPWQHGEVRGELLRPAAADPARALLYLHGGGYGIGSPRSHRHLAAALAEKTGAAVLLPDYRLAPEHPFPAAVEDALAAYRWLLSHHAADRLAIAGDSAGGGLTVATALAARDAGLPLPAALVCLSPWVDLSCPENDGSDGPIDDPLVDHAHIDAYAEAYLGGTPGDHPLASPLFADLKGLPPLLIQASACERLLPDSRRLAAAAERAGVAVTLELAQGVPHVWQWFWPQLELARGSIARIAAFLDRHAGKPRG